MILISIVESVKNVTRMSSVIADIAKIIMESSLLVRSLFQTPILSQTQMTHCITVKRATDLMKSGLHTEIICAEYTRWRWSQHAIPLILIGPRDLYVDSVTKLSKRAKYMAHTCKLITRASWRRDKMDNLENVVMSKIKI